MMSLTSNLKLCNLIFKNDQSIVEGSFSIELIKMTVEFWVSVPIKASITKYHPATPRLSQIKFRRLMFEIRIQHM